MPGTLYLVATPIGNLKDITLRAIDVLREVDLIACEDTRHTQKLLNHFEIKTRTISYHEHNEADRAAQLVERLLNDESIAVVSDAGMPGIADPGFRVVEAAAGAGVTIVPVPGAVAFATAAAASGIATDAIFFGGFLPARTGDRRRRLEECSVIPATLAFYEAPHRLVKSLTDCMDVLGDRKAVVARELTKMHEEIVRGTLSELAGHFSSTPVKGEIVVLIDRGGQRTSDASKDQDLTLDQRVLELQQEGLDKKAALKKAAKEFGLSKSEAYRRLLM
ncbi:MAG TPA: 16S rRNA (cytidine(1402)-2'-O)-methyltransferase [Pyrinomonadaceae bacterium]|nr:16S rRNA (cytidine(1402)-2'-O)-methyltransferase [Pyrinomonadaceae bacterium]